MTAVAESVFQEALQLNPIDRAELIDRLFFSFAPSLSDDIDAKWCEEVEDRITAFEAGKIPADTAENVFKRLSKR
ncbi:addiction module protein [bacterium]|nr:addiction module protein [bacterium]MBU1615270.1 addiction module protein [bacterium]